MIQRKRKIANTLMAAAFAALGATPSLHAVTFAESGDAGQALASAQYTAATSAAGGQPLTNISGTLGTAFDADLFVLTVTSTTTFSATATSTAGIDTSLFLLSSTGAAVMANDDQSGASFQAALPAGNGLLTSLAAGTYYLGISLSGNEPVNFNNQLLFTVDQPTTGVRGAAAGLNPTTESTFNGGTFVTENGPYSIALTGAATLAAVPEPSTYATLLAGGTLAAFALRRRRLLAAL